jgi:hypothetical protein
MNLCPITKFMFVPISQLGFPVKKTEKSKAGINSKNFNWILEY